MNIVASNLHKSFVLGHGVEVRALRGVDLSIDSGETIAVMGPSGAGKSTLLHILGLMDHPSSGRLSFEGRDYSELDETSRSDIRKNEIGFIFQLHYLLPDFNVLENVLIPVWEKRDIVKPQILELLNQLGLSERLNHLPSELSGGEQQRVALARALAIEPKLLLADEPTGNLDRETGQNVENIIFTECKKRNITLVLVTHNPELAEKAGRTIKIKDGLLIS